MGMGSSVAKEHLTQGYEVHNSVNRKPSTAITSRRERVFRDVNTNAYCRVLK